MAESCLGRLGAALDALTYEHGVSAHFYESVCIVEPLRHVDYRFARDLLPAHVAAINH